MRGFAVLSGYSGEDGSGKAAESEMSNRVTRGAKMSADEAGKDWRDQGGDLEGLLTSCYRRTCKGPLT